MRGVRAGVPPRGDQQARLASLPGGDRELARRGARYAMPHQLSELRHALLQQRAVHGPMPGHGSQFERLRRSWRGVRCDRLPPRRGPHVLSTGGLPHLREPVRRVLPSRGRRRGRIGPTLVVVGPAVRGRDHRGPLETRACSRRSSRVTASRPSRPGSNGFSAALRDEDGGFELASTYGARGGNASWARRFPSRSRCGHDAHRRRRRRVQLEQRIRRLHQHRHERPVQGKLHLRQLRAPGILRQGDGGVRAEPRHGDLPGRDRGLGQSVPECERGGGGGRMHDAVQAVVQRIVVHGDHGDLRSVNGGMHAARWTPRASEEVRSAWRRGSNDGRGPASPACALLGCPCA